MSETILHVDDDDIPAFDLEIVNVELKLYKTNYGTNFIDLQYA